MKTCPECNRELREEALFCPFCGTKVGEKRCAHCGAPLTDGAAFCDRCGHRVVQSQSQPAPQPAREKGDTGAWGVFRLWLFIVAIISHLQAILDIVWHDFDVTFVRIIEPLMYGGAAVLAHVMCKIAQNREAPIRQDRHYSLGLRIPILVVAILGLLLSIAGLVAYDVALFNIMHGNYHYDIEDWMYLYGYTLKPLFIAMLAFYVRMQKLSNAYDRKHRKVYNENVII